MVKLVVAKCEQCGAALRLDPNAASVVCEYCRHTLVVRGNGATHAPQVTIAPAPDPLDEVNLTIGVGVVSALVAVGGVVAFVVSHQPGVLVAVALGLMFTVLAAIGVPRKRAYLRHARRLRDRGLPGRATVRSLGAGQGQQATLTLDLEVAGQRRQLRHATSIPMLLIPKVSSGCVLPVLVHPDDPDRIEIQWHLM